ncbi:hypothetical protein N657DRAFT_694068 [Parathielavia appendiculata]|uniref:Polyketide synthase n=1 Tax=Parathielavia appendiculata TaxID=2587402 RepID=A0AAN6TQS7_9PEZI|nr:hypothetical protein N657DRAFT_694068 [Parathielavia appendiculata]
MGDYATANGHGNGIAAGQYYHAQAIESSHGNGTNGTNGKNGITYLNGHVNGARNLNGVYNTTTNGSSGSVSSNTRTDDDDDDDNFQVAICGMALRLPGGLSTPTQLWDFLLAKGDARTRVPESRYNVSAYYSATAKPGTVKTQHGYFLDDASINLAGLDASFFSIPRAELERADPHHRQMLEVAREALDDAGEVAFRGSLTGCYMGSFGEDWCEMFAKDSQQHGLYRVSGYGDFMLSDRVSYEMDLRGPSMTIRTGCSAALVGLHEACQALRRGDCTAAIVGGANLILAPGMTAAMSEQGVLSPEGSCKTFPADADGYARGEAITALYIKPLQAAIRDGNPVRAVIRATATNSDGRTPGISCPSADSHEAMIRRAYKVARIRDYSQTAFVECHGTGTPIGDPIEADAVGRVFGDHGVYIGSVKPNLGHSEGASGLASLIKVVLALENQTIPPNIKFNTPNPAIPFQAKKLTVPVDPTPWPKARLERAGVSAFGIGGANGHVILDSARLWLPKVSVAPDGNNSTEPESEVGRPTLLVCSANSAESLKKTVDNHQAFVAKHPERIKDVAYTLATRREHLPHRAYMVTNSGSTAGTIYPAGKVAPTGSPAVVMVFTGQGAQWPTTGKELLQSNAVFRRTVRALNEHLRTVPDAPSWTIEEELLKPGPKSRLDRAEISQPLCTAVQIALVDVLSAIGVEAAATVGHSSGEIAAAYAAGALTAAEAICTAWRRGAITTTQSRKGVMAAIGMGVADVKPFLVPNVTVACDNSPKSVTLSGDASEVGDVVSRIQKARPDVLARMLKVDKAYHLHHMVEIGEAYYAAIRKDIVGRRPTKPFFSSVTGSLLGEGKVLDARYWQTNLESRVLFHSAAASIIDHAVGQNAMFLELGPHSALSGPLRQILNHKSSSAPYAAAMLRGKDCVESLLIAVGKLFTLGVPIDFHALMGKGVCLPDLPRYPWNHQDSYWGETRLSREWRLRRFPHHDLLGVKLPESTELEPSWRNVLHIQNASWLRDHLVDDDIVFPCAAYIGMVGEAFRQISGVQEGFSVRHLIISAALVLTEGKPVEMITTLRPRRLTDQLDSKWWEFSIASHNGHTWAKHCTGEAGPAGQEEASKRTAAKTTEPLARSVDKARCYDTLRRAGLHYGPSFQTLDDIRSGTLETSATARVVNNKNGDEANYHLHPSIIGAFLQLLSVAATKGIAELTVYRTAEDVNVQATAVPSRRGDLVGSGEITSADGGRQVLHMVEAHMSAIDEGDRTETGGTPSTARYVWGPHIDFLNAADLIAPSVNRALYTPILDELTGLCLVYSHRQLADLQTALPHMSKFREWLGRQLQVMDVAGVLAMDDTAIFDHAVVLVQQLSGTPASEAAIGIFTDECDRSRFLGHLAHTKPNLRVLEIGAGTDASTASLIKKSLILPSGQVLYSKYTFTDISSGFFVAAKERLKGLPNIEYATLDISKDPDDQGFEGSRYDLVIATNVLHATSTLRDSLRHVRHLLAPRGGLLLQELCPSSRWVNYIYGTLPGWWCGELDGRIDEPYVDPARWEAEMVAAGFEGLDAVVLDSSEPFQLNAIMVTKPASTPKVAEKKRITLLSLPGDQDDHSAAQLEAQLRSRGYSVNPRHPGETLPAGQDVGIFTEAGAKGAGVLWVTRLSQAQSQDPRWAQTIGTARTIRSELMVDVATLEVDDFAASIKQIADVFEAFWAREQDDGTLRPDFEYAIIDGVVHVGRLYPFAPADELLVEDINDRFVLGTSRRGRLAALEWRRRLVQTLKADEVEIETYALGLNFRDIMSAMGLMQTSEDGFGLEGSGVVVRLGPGVKDLSVGDKVFFMGRNCCSTHVTVPESMCEKLVDGLSFVDAATMPTVFITVLYSLFNVGGLRKGQSILIHSACGGVGIAAIQLARMAGAEIYTTVGSEDKVQHLMTNFGIPRNRIFHSRNASFVEDVMREPAGKGVDMALNSLSGELLHATWRRVAEFGKMVELGKRDIIGAAKLDMDVFLANRSYCCVDVDQLCFKKPDMCKELMQSIIGLFRDGHIKPIGPTTVFAASAIEDLPLHAEGVAHRTLELDGSASYLLAGGLGGLGRAVSRYMVEHGARRLIYLSRSGGTKAEDQALVRELQSMGCEVLIVQGSVADEADVYRAIQLAPNLKSVINLSMALHDQAFTRMTVDEWNGAVRPKVQGTWHLHNASVAAGATLDFFVLFSSLSGIIGQPGQANYAGANTFLDAFVQFRNRLGLAASAIDIGGVEDAGFISQNEELLRKIKTTMAYSVREVELLEAMRATMMLSSLPATTTSPGPVGSAFVSRNTFVLGLGTHTPLAESRAIWRADRRMAVYHNRAVKGSSDSRASGSSDGLKAFLSSVRADSRVLKTADAKRTLSLEIGKRVFDLLLRPADDLEASMAVPLAHLGMDSLVAIEMRTWWRQALGFDITVLEMLGLGSLGALGTHAVEGLLRAAERNGA